MRGGKKAESTMAEVALPMAVTMRHWSGVLITSPTRISVPKSAVLVPVMERSPNVAVLVTVPVPVEVARPMT